MGEHKHHKKDETEHIHKIAYELWERDGRKQDHDLEYWLKAKEILNINAKS